MPGCENTAADRRDPVMAVPARDSSAAASDGTPDDGFRRRLELICLSLGFAYTLFLVLCVARGYWLIDASRHAIANDFAAVWAAGKLVLMGHPAGAYDWTVHREIEVLGVGQEFDGYYGWHYPPPFLFVAAGLAMLPYLAATMLWLAATLPAFLAAMRAVTGARIGVLLGGAFPGLLWTISAGQNGFLTAALIGGIAVTLQRRPALAGVLLGLLTYKPQFGILFPFVLILDGRWRALATATATASAFAAASFAAFGAESWRAFIAWMPVMTTAVLSDGRAGFNKLQSLFGVVRWLGGSMTAAITAQAVLVAGLILLMLWLWRQPVRYEIKAAALALGSLLATPYLYIYDFPVLAIALAFVMRVGLRCGFLAYELAAIAAAAALVFVFPVFAMPTGFAAALVTAALIARRAADELRSSNATMARANPAGAYAAP